MKINNKNNGNNKVDIKKELHNSKNRDITLINVIFALIIVLAFIIATYMYVDFSKI